MTIFEKILVLSKQTAKDILKGDRPTEFGETDLFNAEEKDSILSELTEDSNIQERLRLNQQVNTKEDWKKVQRRIDFPKKSRFIWKYAAAAVVLVGVMSTMYFYQVGFGSGDGGILIPKEEPITLELENGEIKVLDEKASSQIATTSGQVVGQQEKTKLTYSVGEASEELVYNTLKVPYGKRFDIELSDGTTVFLNAGSSIRYPVAFISGYERQVYLTGEAYLKVSKDSLNPFIVTADELNVEVLGTEFNVLAYAEDKVADVVLVEGSVALSQNRSGEEHEDMSIILQPGQMGTFQRVEGTLSTKDVVTGVYTSWIDGDLVFRNMVFENILRKLERHYNITINNTNTSLAKKEFNASFGNEPIEKVLEYFKISYGIEFTIKDNQVFIE